MFHFSKWLIFNYFITKNETWKINQKFWKCMDIMWEKLQFIEHISIRIQNLCFIFHVSFLYFNSLIINTFKDWNIELQCFILSFMFHFSKHCGSVKALPQCFWIAPSVFLIFSHSVFNMKRWNKKWNIVRLSFIILITWLSTH